MPTNGKTCSPMRQAPRFVCFGCSDVATGEPAGWILHMGTRRAAPTCSGCSLRARESTNFLEQLTRGLGLGFRLPTLRRHVGELSTLPTGWDALEAAGVRLSRRWPPSQIPRYPSAGGQSS